MVKLRFLSSLVDSVAYGAYPKSTLMGRKNRTYGLQRRFKWLRSNNGRESLHTQQFVWSIYKRTHHGKYFWWGEVIEKKILFEIDKQHAKSTIYVTHCETFYSKLSINRVEEHKISERYLGFFLGFLQKLFQENLWKIGSYVATRMFPGSSWFFQEAIENFFNIPARFLSRVFPACPVSFSKVTSNYP